MPILTATATRPVRVPETHTVAMPRINAANVSTADHGDDRRLASTIAPTVQNAITEPSLFASPSVPDARSM